MKEQKEKKAEKREYRNLISAIEKHDQLYFVDAKPKISDYEYDQLVKKAEKLERLHPEWVSGRSPTQNIKSDKKSGFVQVVHAHPMLSLANTYSEEELHDFIKRMDKFLERKKADFRQGVAGLYPGRRHPGRWQRIDGQ